MPSDDPPTCMYQSDDQGAIGVESEVHHDNGALSCEAPADDVLRPKGGWHLREFGPRVPFCRAHANFLVGPAQADWEMLSFGDLSPLRDDDPDTE